MKDDCIRPPTLLFTTESFKLLPLAVGAVWPDSASAGLVGAEDGGVSPYGGASADILLGRRLDRQRRVVVLGLWLFAG